MRDERGVTAVEFGLLALPFFSILGAILETSLILLSGQVLDSAVQDVSRLVRTGQAQNAGMTPERFKERVCERLFGLFSDCNELHVEMNVIDTFGEVDMTPPVKWICDEPEAGETEAEAAATCAEWTRPESFTPGTGGSIVTVQVYYRWPVILPLGGLGLGNLPDGNRLMGAATVFRNEPFT
ncbi:MAG TPA: TadE/TadG family type IV pilus assembly protein [Devosia sp.]|jgi:Flp pilus assembly protein TadG|nr:TadE/TadG family type IV pilus assembly protein [Devosia sp.]